MKREDLLNALEVVRPGLASSDVVEQATSFAFLGNMVVTYNDEISISTPVAGLDVTGAVRAEELYQLLNKIKKDEIEVTIVGSELQLKAGRAKAGIVLQQEIKLPIEEVGKQTGWKPLPEDFAKGIAFAIPSTAKNMSNSILACLHVCKDGYVEASDNFRITRYDFAGKLPTANYLLPASSANDLIKYNVKEATAGKGWVHYRTESGTVVSCRTFSGEYPATDQFLQVKGVEFDLPRTLADLLTRAQIFSVSGQKSAEEVEITLDNNRMKVRGQNEYGWFEEVANVNYTKDPAVFVVNPVHLKTITESVHSCLLSENCLKFSGGNWQHVIALKAR